MTEVMTDNQQIKTPILYLNNNKTNEVKLNNNTQIK